MNQPYLGPADDGVPNVGNLLAAFDNNRLMGTAPVLPASYAARHGITYTWYPFSEAGEIEAAFFTGNCDAISSDVTSLANIRAIVPARAASYTILPQLVRQDPLAAATTGDSHFAAIVNWTLSALLTAEQLGVTQTTVQARV